LYNSHPQNYDLIYALALQENLQEGDSGPISSLIHSSMPLNRFLEFCSFNYKGVSKFLPMPVPETPERVFCRCR
jgi:hypothetical protein